MIGDVITLTLALAHQANLDKVEAVFYRQATGPSPIKLVGDEVQLVDQEGSKKTSRVDLNVWLDPDPSHGGDLSVEGFLAGVYVLHQVTIFTAAGNQFNLTDNIPEARFELRQEPKDPPIITYYNLA